MKSGFSGFYRHVVLHNEITRRNASKQLASCFQMSSHSQEVAIIGGGLVIKKGLYILTRRLHDLFRLGWLFVFNLSEQIRLFCHAL